jgi:hypothetical protein
MLVEAISPGATEAGAKPLFSQNSAMIELDPNSSDLNRSWVICGHAFGSKRCCALE